MRKTAKKMTLKISINGGNHTHGGINAMVTMRITYSSISLYQSK